MVLLIICVNLYSYAHGDLDQRILETSLEIKKHSDSAYLYFKRGKLFYQHNEYKESLKDLKKALKLKHDNGEQKLLFAKNYFRLEKFKKTLLYSNNILETDSKNVLALKVKAQAFSKLGKYEESAITFEKVIAFTTKSFPENYIDASNTWEKLNTEKGIEQASLIIEKGIKNLGNLVSLYDRLIDLSLKQKDYKKAIEYKLEILSFSPRKERVYYRLCELYILNDNPEKALESLNLAKYHFYELPIRIQNTSFMKDLLLDIKEKEVLLNHTKIH